MNVSYSVIVDVGSILFCSFKPGPLSAGGRDHIVFAGCQTEHRC